MCQNFSLFERILILMFKNDRKSPILQEIDQILLKPHSSDDAPKEKSEKQCYLMFYLVISISAYSHCLIYLHACMHACTHTCMCAHAHTHTHHKTSPTKETKYLTSARLGVAMTTECKKYMFFSNSKMASHLCTSKHSKK